MTRVMLHKATYENCREAVDKAFELFPLDLKGRKVLLKPNVLRSSEAGEGIVTHPAVLRAVVEKVESFGPAEIVVGDNPGVFSYGANEESFARTGLTEASKGYYRNIGNETAALPFNPEYLDQVFVSKAIMDADVVISLCKFKTHGLTILTGAIKNSYGFLPGAQKAKLHKLAGSPERFREVIVDVFKLRVPDFFIMDAVVGMQGNGPASPDLRDDIGLILASNNAVAMDAVVAHMMGLDPAKLGFLQKARAEGLGDYDLDKLEILGELRVLPDFKLPPLSGEAIQNNKAMQEFMSQRLTVRPKADPESCISCGVCIDHCPVSALSMNDDIPVVDPEKCITCFCCQEMCPEQAITLK